MDDLNCNFKGMFCLFYGKKTQFYDEGYIPGNYYIVAKYQHKNLDDGDY